MKKLFIAILISVSVIGIAITQMEITAQSGLTGSTVSFSSEVISSNEAITQDRADELLKAGQPLLFKSNGKLYFVLNSAGNLDTKNLARYAGTDYTIDGKVRAGKGFNFIIAKKYQ